MSTLNGFPRRIMGAFFPNFTPSGVTSVKTGSIADFWVMVKRNSFPFQILAKLLPTVFAEPQVSPWPTHVALPPPPPPPSIVHHGIRATYIGHATVLLQLAGLNIVTDPNFSSKISFCGPFKYYRRSQAGVAKENLPPIDAILLSHDHRDSYDKSSVNYLTLRDRSTVYTGLGMSKYLRRRCANLYAMPWWDETPFCDISVQYVPSVHYSGRSLWGRYSTLWGGFLLKSSTDIIYFAGDSGFGTHFDEIRLLCEMEEDSRPKRISLAILPIGGYSSSKSTYHMTPEEAVKAHIRLNALNSIAISHDVFPRGFESYGEASCRLCEALKSHGIPDGQFRLLQPGEHLDIADSLPVICIEGASQI